MFVFLVQEIMCGKVTGDSLSGHFLDKDDGLLNPCWVNGLTGWRIWLSFESWLLWFSLVNVATVASWRCWHSDDIVSMLAISLTDLSSEELVGTGARDGNGWTTWSVVPCQLNTISMPLKILAYLCKKSMLSANSTVKLAALHQSAQGCFALWTSTLL